MTFLSGASYLTEEGFWLYTEDPPFSEALKLLEPFLTVACCEGVIVVLSGYYRSYYLWWQMFL